MNKLLKIFAAIDAVGAAVGEALAPTDAKIAADIELAASGLSMITQLLTAAKSTAATLPTTTTVTTSSASAAD